VAALRAEQRGDTPVAVRFLDVRNAERELQVVRIALDDAVCDVDLLKLDARETELLDVVGAGDPDGPELRADMALTQPCDIGIPRRGLVQIVGIDIAQRRPELTDHVRQVVVPIDQQILLEQLVGVLQGRFGLGIRGNRNRGGGYRKAEDARDGDSEALDIH